MKMKNWIKTVPLRFRLMVSKLKIKRMERQIKVTKRQVTKGIKQLERMEHK